jgi:hypothetical protein
VLELAVLEVEVERELRWGQRKGRRSPPLPRRD